MFSPDLYVFEINLIEIEKKFKSYIGLLINDRIIYFKLGPLDKTKMEYGNLAKISNAGQSQ